MREDTRKVLDSIKNIESISDFLLVGGTAISIHANHRVSEDLDFAFTNGLYLPKDKINKIIEVLSESYSVSHVTSQAAIDDSLNEGIDLLDHHQDWLVDNVKLTFFTIMPKESKEVNLHGTVNDGYVKILDLDGLFYLKCNALMNRIKTRDIFDLWWYVKSGDKSINDIFNTIQKDMPHVTYEAIRYRLIDHGISKSDEGLESVIKKSFNEVRSELCSEIKKMETRIAIKLNEDFINSLNKTSNVPSKK